MKLLAIDTSTETASVALMTGLDLLCEEQNNHKTHAHYILPMIDRLMSDAGLQMNQLDGIVFGQGPGSFTGLRIACSIAKGLAYAHDLDLYPLSTLVAIAWSVRQQVQRQDVPILAALDARMHELYWAYFAAHQWVAEECVTPAKDLVIPEGNSCVLAGSGIELYWDDFNPIIKLQISERIVMNPSAAAMIQFTQFSGLNPVPTAQAQPVYVRNKVT